MGDSPGVSFSPLVDWQEEGVLVNRRKKANFVGAQITVTDDPANNRILITSTAGGGDMLAATYDPGSVAGDAFDTDNHVDGSTNGVYTLAERSKLAGVEATADITDATNVAASGAVMDADFTAADEVMVGTGSGTHAQVTLAASQFLAKKAAGAATNVTASEARTILNVADGANAYVHPNHSGEVTSNADGAQTIANDAVTYAKMQNVSATDKVLGRASVGAGDVEEIACTAAGRALIDDATAADQKTTLSLNNVENTAHSTDAHTMTIDGRDVSVDGSKLDGIEAGANVTDAANVAAAGAMMVADIDDTPVDNETSASISSNWAYDHVAAADPHTGYQLESEKGSNSGYCGLDAGGLVDKTDLPDATTSADGISELAIASEVTTGTDATRAVTPDALAGSDYGKRIVMVKLIDDATALATGDGKFYFAVPAELNGYNLVGAHAFVSTASSSGTPTYQIHNLTDTSDMLSTLITIDANEYTSYSAATPPVINASEDDVVTADILRIDKDVAGTGEKGDGIILSFQLP